MNIFELQKRLHNSAFSGAGLIDEDFRLKKAIEQFSEISGKSPVFAKVYQAVKPLTDSSTENKSEVLLDAIILVDAVCTAMSDSHKPQNVEVLERKQIKVPVQEEYSHIVEVQIALTTTGTGRTKTVNQSYTIYPAVFKDYRIKPLLVKAIDDKSIDMAELCKKIIFEIYPDEAIDMMKYGLSLDGHSSSLRRFRFIEEFAKEKENDFYISIIENPDASLGFKRCAVNALRFTEENGDLLADLCVNNKKLTYEAYCVLLNFKKSNPKVVEAINIYEKRIKDAKEGKK